MYTRLSDLAQLTGYMHLAEYHIQTQTRSFPSLESGNWRSLNKRLVLDRGTVAERQLKFRDPGFDLGSILMSYVRMMCATAILSACTA